MDGLPESNPADSRHTIIEARTANGWERIASSTEPIFCDGSIYLERVVLNQVPEFTLHPIPVEVWLTKKMLAVTSVFTSVGRHSTTSWVCEFAGCYSATEVSPDTGVYVLLNARFRF